MSSDGSFPSQFRDSLRFGFPASSWTSSWSSAEAADGSGLQREDGCSYTKVVKSRCFLERSSDGKPVKKCEKTEQILRNCVGRPQEIIESKLESTEEEVPDGWTMEAFDDEEKGIVPFSYEKFPGAPWKPSQGIDPFSRGFSDGIESFMQAAEEMMNDALNQLGFFKHDEGSDGARPRSLQKKHPSGRIIGEEGNPSSRDERPLQRKTDFKDSRSFDEV